VTGNGSYNSGRRIGGLGMDQTKEKGALAWCSSDWEMAASAAPISAGAAAPRQSERAN
jgi:hypothetical protein